MGLIKSIHVTSESANQRIDKFLSSIGQGFSPALSRSFIQRLINNNRVTVSGKTVKTSYKVKIGDEIKIEFPELKPPSIKPEPIPLDIVYEDESVIVVNKSAGMVVHPAGGTYSRTLVNALLYHCRDTLSGIGGVERPGIVHRLDKDTSGLLMVAKDDFTHRHLSKQLRDRTIVRKYLALVKGNIKEDSKRIEMPIGRHVSDRKKMSTKTRKGRLAITEFKVVERFGDYTLLEVRLKTGRTHQIRVHLSSIGHPVAGDRIYGRNKKQEAGSKKKGIMEIHRQMLHANTLGFIHPKTGGYLEFETSIPADMESVLKFLKSEI